MFIFKQLLPQKNTFFALFNQHADQICLGAQVLVKTLNILNNEQGPAKDEIVQRHITEIETIESKADHITHEVIVLLHRSFITPLEREDIHTLINCLDDVIDIIQDSAMALSLYDVAKTAGTAEHLADISLSCCRRLRSAVRLLPKMTDPSTALRLCQEIDQLETEADRVVRRALSDLFRNEANVREIIKLKEVYELLENIPDRCEDAANVIEGIILEIA